MSVTTMPGCEQYIVGGWRADEEEVGARRGLLVRDEARPLGVELLARVDARREALRGVSVSSSIAVVIARLRGAFDADAK